MIRIEYLNRLQSRGVQLPVGFQSWEQVQRAMIYDLESAVNHPSGKGGLYHYIWIGGPISQDVTIPLWLCFMGWMRAEYTSNPWSRFRPFKYRWDVFYITDKGRAALKDLLPPAHWEAA